MVRPRPELLSGGAFFLPFILMYLIFCYPKVFYIIGC